MELIIFIVFVLGLAGIITYFNNRREKKKREKKIEQVSNYQTSFNVDLNTLNEKELQITEIQEIKKMYIQMIDLEMRLEKTEQHLDSIKTNTEIVVLAILLPIALKIVGAIAGITFLNDIL